MPRLGSCAAVDDALTLDMVVLSDGCHTFSNTCRIRREQLPGRLHFFCSWCKAPIQGCHLVVEHAQRALKTNGPATPRRLVRIVWCCQEAAVRGTPPGPYRHH